MAHRYLFTVVSIFALTTHAQETDNDEIGPFVSRIACANRGSGEGLLIESDNELAQLLLTLPADAEPAEPMYISASILTNEFYVGDRANNQLIVYDTTTLQQTQIIPIECNGIFHQFYNLENQLWIVCDLENKILVLDTVTKVVLATIDIANVPFAYQPHDISASRDYAYVTLLRPNDNDEDAPPFDGHVIQYSTVDFEEVNRITVGGDPHVWVDCCPTTDTAEGTESLFIAAQDNGRVYRANVETLEIEDLTDINGAHGIIASDDYLYVTDITSPDGVDSLYVLDRNDFSNIRTFDAVDSVPHNLMIDSDEDHLFVTHSGTGSVTVYDIQSDGGLANGRMIFQEAGSVPFGIMNLVGLAEYQALTEAFDVDFDVDLDLNSDIDVENDFEGPFVFGRGLGSSEESSFDDARLFEENIDGSGAVDAEGSSVALHVDLSTGVLANVWAMIGIGLIINITLCWFYHFNFKTDKSKTIQRQESY